MTLTEVGQALNTAAQSVNQQATANPNTPAPVKSVVNYIGANEAYLFTTGVFTVCVFLGGDPEVPGT